MRSQTWSELGSFPLGHFCPTGSCPLVICGPSLFPGSRGDRPVVPHPAEPHPNRMAASPGQCWASSCEFSWAVWSRWAADCPQAHSILPPLLVRGQNAFCPDRVHPLTRNCKPAGSKCLTLQAETLKREPSGHTYPAGRRDEWMGENGVGWGVSSTCRNEIKDLKLLGFPASH